MKELLTWADPYNITSNADDEMHTYVPCKQRCDSCVNFVVAKSNFKCFATKRIDKVKRSTSCIFKNVIYIAFCLNCLKQEVKSTVDCKLDYGIINPIKRKRCSLVAMLITFLMFVVTQMIPQEILDFILLINSIIQTVFLQMPLKIYYYKKKYFGFQRLSPYTKDLKAHMIGIKNIVQNALNKDRPYEN